MRGRWGAVAIVVSMMAPTAWVATDAQARPLEYYAERTLPDGRRVKVSFVGDVSKGQLRGDLTVGDAAYDVNGVFEKAGNIFVAVSKPGGAAVATFDGTLTGSDKINGVIAPTTNPTAQIPLSIPMVHLQLRDAK